MKSSPLKLVINMCRFGFVARRSVLASALKYLRTGIGAAAYSLKQYRGGLRRVFIFARPNCNGARRPPFGDRTPRKKPAGARRKARGLKEQHESTQTDGFRASVR
ncbi:unnamed protein product, partial [Iphiclides podalirius]